MLTIKHVLCLIMISSSTHCMLEKYYPNAGLKDYEEFFYEGLEDSIKYASLANLHELIVIRGVACEHKKLINKNILALAISNNYFHLANIIIRSEIDLTTCNHKGLLFNLFEHYEQNSFSALMYPELYTSVCPNLIRYGTPLNISKKTGITKDCLGKDVPMYTSTFKKILNVTINIKEEISKKIFEQLITYMLELGLIPRDNYHNDYDVMNNISQNVLSKIMLTNNFFSAEIALPELVQAAKRLNVLPFLATFSFTHNGYENNYNTADILWLIQDDFSTKKKKPLLIDAYNAWHAKNKLYRNGYHVFKRMFMLYKMYQKESFCDIQFSFQ